MKIKRRSRDTCVEEKKQEKKKKYGWKMKETTKIKL